VIYLQCGTMRRLCQELTSFVLWQVTTYNPAAPLPV
jgi:hypothetical protein